MSDHVIPRLPSGRAFTEEQTLAIERRQGDLLLDASAGSGKTSVLVERFVRAVLEDGIEAGRILTITFTEKAAAELRERIRLRLRECGADDAVAAIDTAWISTIHGFCARVLRAHALRAGLDPGFAVLEQVAAEALSDTAFADAVEALALGDPAAVALIAAYGAPALQQAIISTYAELRSRGERRPRLPALPAEPDTAALRRAVLAAGATAAAELARAPRRGVRVQQALERLERLDAVACAEDPSPSELDQIALPKNGGMALDTDACRDYRAALARLRGAAEHRRAVVAHALLGELLAGYGERYEAGKREAAGIDFDDLELCARDLLTDPEVSGRYRERFTHVMVDEMQDTNRVQLELIELVAAGEAGGGRGGLFTVGDAQQSIYGFRHAADELFERRGAELGARGARATLQTNFRSHPRLVELLNAGFEVALGERFRPLRAGREAPDPAQPPVELLIADKGADWETDGLSAPWRLAEARALARRVAELVREGTAPGDVVVLTRATTDLRAYERALEDAGIPTYLIGGRGYWAHPQVIDVVSYLTALANPREEMALLTTLASPMLGVSLDTLVALTAAARSGRRDVWSVLGDLGGGVGETAASPGNGESTGSADTADTAEPAQPAALAALSPGERERLRTFADWLAAERRTAARIGVAELISRALRHTGYDLAVLRMHGGERRLANVRKLMRLAQEHALTHGPDLRGFLDAAARRAAGEGARESEAPVESEGLDAVRLMTIHRSKGLEFPVVCVADLGRAPIRWPPLMRVGTDGRFGLRLSEPGTGRAEPALAYAALNDEQLAAEQAEERRLFYVAMTRAREHLILSGAARLEQIGAGATPIAWIAPAFVPEIAARTTEHAGIGEGGVAFTFVRPADEAGVADPGAADAAPGEATAGEVGGAQATAGELAAVPVDVLALPVALRDRAAPDTPEDAARAAEALANPRLFEPAAEPDRPPSLGAPTAAPVSTLSYSALAAYGRCGYRFYAERVLGLPAAPPLPPAPGGSAIAAGGHAAAERAPERLAATERGTLVHALLERLDFRRPAPPDADAVIAAAGIAGCTAPGREEAERIAALVAAFAETDLCRRLAAAGPAAREERFAFPIDGDVLITGAVDVLARERGGAMLIVDYKSDALDGRDPVLLADRAYGVQRTIYALAALRAGALGVDVAHVFLEAPQSPALAHFAPSDAPRLEARLRGLARGVLAHEFPVANEPRRGLCDGCPAEGGLCSWPAAMTRREAPDRLF